MSTPVSRGQANAPKRRLAITVADIDALERASSILCALREIDYEGTNRAIDMPTDAVGGICYILDDVVDTLRQVTRNACSEPAE